MRLRSWLFAPGHDWARMETGLRAGADAVVLDLQAAGAADAPDDAREQVAETVRAHADDAGRSLLFVRVNQLDSGLTREDLLRVVQRGLDGVWLPGVASQQDLWRTHPWVAEAEQQRGLPVGMLRLVCGIECAAGVWLAREIAQASPRVLGLAFDAEAFVRDVGARPESGDGVETLYARSHLVLASRVAGVRPPLDGVYAGLDGIEGLERTTRQSRALGFSGRAAMDPRQVEVINRVHSANPADAVEAHERAPE